MFVACKPHHSTGRSPRGQSELGLNLAAEESWQSRFLTMLPKIRHYAEMRFRKPVRGRRRDVILIRPSFFLGNGAPRALLRLR